VSVGAVPILLLALPALMTGTYSSLRVLQGLNPRRQLLKASVYHSATSARIRVVHPVNEVFHLTHHQCVYCAPISFPGMLGPGYEFFLSTTGDNHSSSIAQLSPSSSLAGPWSSCWQSETSNSSNPHSPHLHFEEGSIWEIKSSNSSNPHSPQVYRELGSDGKAKG
jgi:hypothetical protein